MPGYELVVVGAVVAGSTQGIPLRAFSEVVAGNFVARLEAPVALVVDGESWLVTVEAERLLRPLAADWGYQLPRQPVASPRAGWLAYGSGVSPGPAMSDALDALAPGDALLVDPAGLSLWRSVKGLSRGWALVERHHTTVATLATALRDKAPT